MAKSSLEREVNSALAPIACRIRLRAQDLWLGYGQFVIGRSNAHIVVPHKLVSRRHALLDVRRSGVHLQDLGSVNGVFVNGERLGSTARSLVDGDRIVIGAEELVFYGSATFEDTGHVTEVTVAERDVITPGDSDEDEHPMPTHRISSMELLGPIAEKSLAMGRAEEAERLLGEHLKSILGDARAGRRVLPKTFEKASHFAVRFAQTMGKGSWFDYVVVLHDALACPWSDQLVVEMQVALARVDAADSAHLDHYLATLKKLLPRFDTEEKRLVQRVEEIVEMARRKRKTGMTKS